jgi:hypothetical protein
MTIRAYVLPALASGLAFAAAGAAAQGPQPVYQTYGVHNPGTTPPCQGQNCVYARGPGVPPDPIYPPYWSSRWTMYRVFRGYQAYPPPYRGAPPKPLLAGRDYEVSYGATYYDSTWSGAWGRGAMKEHYDRRCLPIFPIPNNYSCSFISLGDVAFFVTYADRPAWMPKVCLFSPVNHPPPRDFIAHLPYSADDSRRLGPRGQGYSFWVDPVSGAVIRTGARYNPATPDAILFGYAFAPGAAGKIEPQSFYFSGSTDKPPNAPIVTQNYTGFAATRPPASTWAEVAGLDPKALPACQLFDPPKPGLLRGTRKMHPTWADIGRWPRR